ncbi:9377_t:CDS:2, partial [Paraglomus brasilianum]
LLDAVPNLQELKKIPGLDLHPLKGKRQGQHAIKVNDQFRVCFIWGKDNNVYEPIHPGEIIREEFMLPLHLTSEKLAQDIKLAPQEVEAVIQEKKDLNMDLICRLSAYFDLPVEF